MSPEPYPQIVGALAGEFTTLPPEVIERCVVNEAQRFLGVRLPAFVPILVEKAARQELRGMVSAQR